MFKSHAAWEANTPEGASAKNEREQSNKEALCVFEGDAFRFSNAIDSFKFKFTEVFKTKTINANYDVQETLGYYKCITGGLAVFMKGNKLIFMDEGITTNIIMVTLPMVRLWWVGNRDKPLCIKGLGNLSVPRSECVSNGDALVYDAKQKFKVTEVNNTSELIEVRVERVSEVRAERVSDGSVIDMRDTRVGGGKAKAKPKATKPKAAKAKATKAKPKPAHVKTARKDAAGRVIYRSVKTGADVVRRKGPAGAKMVWRKASTSKG